ncbi:AAA family ATPase [Bombella sp. TMW 2.2543]|uniref:AAA family ATPase n=1 Tax=Bombella pluederhausensis TaxID=2967336 RepID=A0ABT3WJ63_9PROT|nr:MoxR family ATPase [Bombella pluederhausensis]MCX5618240.1 AAA family ATPase [Bombella pluederhausensis]
MTQNPSASGSASPQGEALHHDETVLTFDGLAPRLKALTQEIGQIVLGQEAVIENVLTTLLGGGHALLLGAPGLGKTLLVNTCAHVLGLEDSRIQFTPDLMPSDITGAEILEQDEQGKRHFRFLHGPLFGQLVLADEINRASPRTQSALLQAMAEGHVTQGGKTWALPKPFHVLATQNPIEQEGTYPLPEAQLDRFMMRIPLDFPARNAERRMLLQTTGATKRKPERLFSTADLLTTQKLVRTLPVGETVIEAILNIVRGLRPQDETASDEVRNALDYGPGPRAAQALMIASRARAMLHGRLSPSLEDVRILAEPVLAHRLGINFAAQTQGVDARQLIAGQLKRLG